MVKSVSVRIIHSHTRTGKSVQPHRKCVSFSLHSPRDSVRSEGSHPTHCPDPWCWLLKAHRLEEHRKTKPCLPILLPGIIHQQTLAQKALALLSTETSELEFGCCLCLKSENLLARWAYFSRIIVSTSPCLVRDNKHMCFFLTQYTVC